MCYANSIEQIQLKNTPFWPVKAPEVVDVFEAPIQHSIHNCICVHSLPQQNIFVTYLALFIFKAWDKYKLMNLHITWVMLINILTILQRSHMSPRGYLTCPGNRVRINTQTFLVPSPVLRAVHPSSSSFRLCKRGCKPNAYGWSFFFSVLRFLKSQIFPLVGAGIQSTLQMKHGVVHLITDI